MYGGFAYWLSQIGEIPDGDDEQPMTSVYPVLVTESWCRVVDGSGQCHIVTPHGYTLVADGTV